MTTEKTKTPAKLVKDDKKDIGKPLDLESEAGEGNNFDKDDLVIPRIAILQALSPQRQKAKAEYIEGAEEGEIFNSSTLKRTPGETGLIVVPVAYRRAYIEWRMRTDDGGGFVADHGTDRSILDKTKKDEQGRDITADKTQIVTTAEYFIAIVDPDTGRFEFAVLSMASTNYKKAKRWNTMISNYELPSKDGGTYNPPMYARSYSLKTVPESNTKGAWYSWDVAAGVPIGELPNGENLLKEIREFRAQILSGAVKAAPESSGGSGAPEDEDLPF